MQKNIKRVTKASSEYIFFFLPWTSLSLCCEMLIITFIDLIVKCNRREQDEILKVANLSCCKLKLYSFCSFFSLLIKIYKYRRTISAHFWLECIILNIYYDDHFKVMTCLFLFAYKSLSHHFIDCLFGFFFWSDFLCRSPEQSCVFLGLQQHQSICRIGRPSQDP